MPLNASGQQTQNGKGQGRSIYSDLGKVAQRVKENVNIVEVMENAGIEFHSKTEQSASCKCFLHDDKDPSLVVSCRKGLYNCFGASCKAGGDAINFYMQYHRVDFATAISALVVDHGIDVSDLVRDPTPEEKERFRLIDINNRVTEFLHEQFKTTKRATDWAIKRGITDQATVALFKLGYSANVNKLDLFLKRIQCSDADKKKLEFGNKALFTDRVIYPIQALDGSTHSFYGRRLGEIGPKYVGCSSSHPLLDKAMPYGLVHARQGLSAAKPLILVEGHNDTLVAHCNGVTSVAGMHGSSPGKDMYALLSAQNVTDIVVCPDGDAAGIRTIRDISESKDQTQRVKVTPMPKDMDPDEYIIKYGADEFVKRTNEAMYPIEIFIGHVAEKMGDSISTKLEAVRSMSEHMAHLVGFERELAIQELSGMTGISVEQIDNVLADMGEVELSDPELEAQLLHDAMGDRMKAVTCMSRMTPTDFSVQRNSRIFKTIIGMVNDDIEPFTKEMLITYAIDKELLNEEEIGVLPAVGLGGKGVDYIIDQLLDMGKRRNLKKSAESLARSVKISKGSVSDILAAHMRSISTQSTSQHQITKAEDHIITVMDKIHERIAHPGIPGVHVGPGWKKFMNQIMGFQRGHMLSVAGISKAGKTTIAQNWCISQLRNAKEPTLWINLEMSEMDITIRNLAIMTGIESQRLKIGNISKLEKIKLDDASAEYHGFPLYVASMAGGSIYDVVNVIRNYVYSKGVRIVFIDYLQLIASGGRSGKESLWEAQNEVVASIREAISQLKITGVVISQLNRGAMAAESASGQYVSGTIKLIQDSDAFMGIRSKTKAEMVDAPHSNSSLLIEFNRHGPQNSQIDLDFKYESSQVEEA